MLDACCGVGGITRGFQNAGCHVTGIDINPQPDYCGDSFVQSDAVEYIREHGSRFDFIHVSPPCQVHSALTKGTNWGRQYGDILRACRKAVQSTGRPWVIENVAGAPIRKDLMLCGEMFGLRVIRHRFFEFSPMVTIKQPVHRAHRGRVAGYRHGEWFNGPYFAVYGDGGGKGSIQEWRNAMQIDWTWNRKSIAEAIPPAYSEWIWMAIRDQIK